MSDWSPWQSVEPSVHCSPSVLAEVLDGGQAFRWNPTDEHSWIGSWSNHVAELRSQDGIVQWRAPAYIADRVSSTIAGYLRPDQDHNLRIDQLPWRSDPSLASAMDPLPGLRILRQPFGETLLCFLCSSMKQIVSIKQLCETLAQRFGQTIVEDIDRLPTWNELHHVSESELRSCGLGYRARYIHGVAHYLAGQPGWLDIVESLPYPQAKAKLMELPGVGEKIADCTLLFGGDKLEAFPVDTWIARVMKERYGLDDWSVDQIAHFGRIHFGSNAGLAQQYLFSSARRKT